MITRATFDVGIPTVATTIVRLFVGEGGGIIAFGGMGELLLSSSDDCPPGIAEMLDPIPHRLGSSSTCARRETARVADSTPSVLVGDGSRRTMVDNGGGAVPWWGGY